ncbi:hypothetical protein NBRC111894_1543 [Sporolactobacillus inulinus]|uniref:Uncharacterized protein n=1 Tax=Sporolactobacillus inulinus TaxID=2078 RepID=A0A4Y1ZAC3_9BACL|nr:hypothetical protein NBRC111894_1543 [Sporolactobacillus inulinus]
MSQAWTRPPFKELKTFCASRLFYTGKKRFKEMSVRDSVERRVLRLTEH